MIVKELMELLATKPPEAEVLLSTYESDLVDRFALRSCEDIVGGPVVVLDEV